MPICVKATICQDLWKNECKDLDFWEDILEMPICAFWDTYLCLDMPICASWCAYLWILICLFVQKPRFVTIYGRMNVKEKIKNPRFVEKEMKENKLCLALPPIDFWAQEEASVGACCSVSCAVVCCKVLTCVGACVAECFSRVAVCCVAENFLVSECVVFKSICQVLEFVVWQDDAEDASVGMCCSVLQCVAVCCSA